MVWQRRRATELSLPSPCHLPQPPRQRHGARLPTNTPPGLLQEQPGLSPSMAATEEAGKEKVVPWTSFGSPNSRPVLNRWHDPAELLLQCLLPHTGQELAMPALRSSCKESDRAPRQDAEGPDSSSQARTADADAPECWEQPDQAAVQEALRETKYLAGRSRSHSSL